MTIMISRHTTLGAACAALALLAAPQAGAAQGDPIPGRDIVLEGDPGAITVARAVTDAKGAVTFRNLKAGRYVVVMPNTSGLPGPARLRISADVTTLRVQNYLFNNTSGQGGKAYAIDEAGKRLVIPMARDGGRISLELSIFDRWGNQKR
ncbi:carboxypeptidase-like regulatory domain-containing protein [Phenylobacterium sp.]|uniref:carboxypeptidase-like regulatory domain-containing protein n=1 Tax=Phenylobacterium sp. TaxID=1871053 RepID=UPI0030F45CF3